MSQRRSTVTVGDTLDPAVVGRRATRVGLALVAAALPLVVGTLAGIAADAPTVEAAFTAALGVMDAPVFGQHGTQLLFHVGTLGLLAGCWVLGVGLLLDGLFD
ncbi:hypothetical protein [Haloarcula marina]|uniref:hypothetical protein n=1 Tax=Haloarcula marina TaxID=2961574 RepID=UPI0020B7B253|nr:hypothetical protein [Halomicroarcula marina]